MFLEKEDRYVYNKYNRTAFQITICRLEFAKKKIKGRLSYLYIPSNNRVIWLAYNKNH